MATSFIIAADVQGKLGVTTNYYQGTGPFFTTWGADCRRAKKFETRALARRAASGLSIGTSVARVVKCDEAAA